jgi:hypothetical protein
VLDEQWPLTYLRVYAAVEVDPDLDRATDLMVRITEVMAGHPMPPEARADVESAREAAARAPSVSVRQCEASATGRTLRLR